MPKQIPKMQPNKKMLNGSMLAVVILRSARLAICLETVLALFAFVKVFELSVLTA